MPAMDVSGSSSECANEMMLLERVFLRLGSADTDEQLESCLNKFLAPVILKLSSPHEPVRTKVMELLVHVNKRVRCRSEVQLPVSALLHHYCSSGTSNFVTNFAIIYLTMGFPRLPRLQQLELVPTLLGSVENKPQSHQDSVLVLVMPLLGELKADSLNLKEKPRLAKLILAFATDILLLPYRALPSNKEEGTEFQVPPGMSMKSYKRITSKNIMNANQLEETKLSIVNFLGNATLPESDMLLPLIVAAADSRFSVANQANSPLARVASTVDWSSVSVLAPLYSLYLGTWTGSKVASDDRKMAACTRLRLKLLHYLNKATGAGVMFPHCVQVIFTSLFDENSNSRLRNLAISFVLVVINNGGDAQMKQVSPVLLEGLLKVIRGEDYAEHHARAYTCIGRLAVRMPSCVNSQFVLLEEFIKKMAQTTPDMKTALRDALLDMALAFRVTDEAPTAVESKSPEPMEVEPAAGGSRDKESEKMEVDEVEKEKPTSSTQPHALALFALLDHYMHSEESMIRYIAMRYASVVFAPRYMPGRYLLLLASGDSQDDISNEALKCLYGTSRPAEIEGIVNNTSNTDTNKIVDSAQRNDSGHTSEYTTPEFHSMVNYVWEQMQKRKKGSNAKHRFVFGNQVLPFHPHTYYEILRYLRMCLNRSADLKDCSSHPNATSPQLSTYIALYLMDTEVLERYLTMITSLLAASPDIMPLTCFLDIIGCAPSLASKYTGQLTMLKNLIVTSLKEEVRETASVLYAVITAHTSEKSAIDREVLTFVEQATTNKTLESQCGYVSVFSNLAERCIRLSRRGKFGGKGFAPADWEPYKAGALCLANLLTSSNSIVASTAVTNIALLARTCALPYPASSPEQDAAINSDKPFNKLPSEEESGPVTKYSIVERLFGIVSNPKFNTKIKEKSLHALGLLCCGERFPFAKQIVKGFLNMATDTKELEIHLEVGESLVLCVEGVNSNESRDLWSEAQQSGETKIKDMVALEENDALLNWLLEELFALSKKIHPNSRQATSIWLLAFLKNCSERQPIKSNLPTFQEVFMDFLSENSEIVQDVASKGLNLVHQSSPAERREALVSQLIEQVTSGKRQVAKVTEDTKIFEEGQLGTAPTGGNLSTYKELCSLASDLNQPDLVYKFMHLANHNALWNSKKGAALGFQSIAVHAGAQLSQYVPKIVPRLYRYRFDPTPRIQNSMCGIWSALVPETTKTVQKYHKEILDDLITNMTSNQWRVRMSCCNALSDLLRGAVSLKESKDRLSELWSQLFRVMDDVHEGTRAAAANTATTLSKLCIRASDANQGKEGKEIVEVIMPVLLEKGITNTVREVRSISLQTVSKLVSAAGGGLKQMLPQLIPALVTAAGELESVKLSYLSAALGSDSGTQQVVDDVRAAAARSHYTTDTVVKCVPYIDIETLNEMLPKMLELSKSPQLGTKVACCHFFTLVTHHLRRELQPVAGKIMLALLAGTVDRNTTVRKTCADALGQVTACAKDSSVEKLMKKLVTWYEEKDDDITRSAVALSLKSVAKAEPELLKTYAEIIAPTIFLAMHAEKNEESNNQEMFEEIWTELSPGKETGMRTHLVAISAHLQKSLESRSWTSKVQAAKAISTLASLTGGLGEERERLLRALLAAAHGTTFDGKQHVVSALATVCALKDGVPDLSPALLDSSLEALVVQCRKSEPVYKRACLGALGDALAGRDVDKFQHVLDIVKPVLQKEGASKDSDDEDGEGARKRREELTQLQEACYEILGKAWPTNPDTQGKYQELVFSHCAQAYPASTRSTQLAILSAVARVLPELAVLKTSTHTEGLAAVVSHTASIVEYTLKSSNQTRHRRDALGILNTLATKLKECGHAAEFEQLRTIYQTYAPELANEQSYEIRARLDDGKRVFN